MKAFSIRAIVVAALAVILVGLVGCGILEKVSLDNLNKDKTSQSANDQTQTAEDKALNDITTEPEPTAIEDKEQNKNQDQKGTTEGPTNTAQATNEKSNIVLYFASEDGKNLVAEKREITFVTGIGKATIAELIKGPKNTKLRKTIPEGTKMMDIDIQNGLATISFSKEMHEKHMGGSNGEQLTLYSVVNTLTQFPTVNKVQFLIDGQAVETLAGHADITKPLVRNETLIKK